MNEVALIERWKREEQEPFAGWDFSYLEGRYSEEQPPWTYEAVVRELLRDADSVLDLGTGGGEKLLELRDALPARTVATEGWEPNVPVARANLEPHGIELVEYNIDTTPRMPFEDGSFGLIIDRHEAYDAREVARLLRLVGVFLTQQVDGRELGDFRVVFGMETAYPHVTLENCRREVEEAGLVVERAEDWQGKATYRDVGALVYFLRAAPWSAPDDFSVERYAEPLLALYRRGEPLTFAIRRFLIQARKPAAAT